MSINSDLFSFHKPDDLKDVFSKPLPLPKVFHPSIDLSIVVQYSLLVKAEHSKCTVGKQTAFNLILIRVCVILQSQKTTIFLAFWQVFMLVRHVLSFSIKLKLTKTVDIIFSTCKNIKYAPKIWITDLTTSHGHV